MFRILTFAAFYISFVFSPVFADQQLTIDVQDNQRKEQVDVLLRGERAKITSRASQKSELIYDNKTRQIFIINHLKKTVITVNQAMLTQWSSLSDSVANIAREQGGVLGGLLETFGLQTSEQDTMIIKLSELSEQRRYAGVNCKILKITQDDQWVTQLCRAPNLGFTGEEHKTLLGLLSFSQELLKNGKVLLNQFNVPIPILPNKPINGTPVFFEDKPNQVSGQLTQVSQAQYPVNHYEVPEGYSESLFGF